MAASLPLGQFITGTPIETDAQGNQVTVVPANIAWTIADNTIASFVVDATTGIAKFQALKAGATTATVTDSANNLTGSDTLTVTDTPTGLTIQWGTPTTS